MNILHQRNAYILATRYGLCPEPDLKYEPWFVEQSTFCYSMASKHRSHNFLAKFNEVELQRKWAATGTLGPDATGNYETFGWYNDRNHGRRTDGAFFIWWDGIDTWYISSVLGVPGTAYWDKTDGNITGSYTARGTATGEATVAEDEDEDEE